MDELAVGTGAFGMHNTLWDTLTVEVSEKVNVVEVCEIIDERNP